MTRSAIVRQHRDLGIVVAPILLLSFLTGAMMALPAVEALVLRPFASPAELAAERKPPRAQWSPLVQSLDWAGVIETARDRYPQAVLRVIGLPAKPGAPITIRVRQPGEWVPNGSTLLWFDPATGRLIGERDVRRLSRGVRLITLEYPLHAGKVGTLAWRLALTLGGLALTMLGTLVFITFWRSLLASKPIKCGI